MTRQEDYLTAEEAGQLVGIRPQTLYRLANSGRCPAIRVPGTRMLRFPKRALLEWIESGRLEKRNDGPKRTQPREERTPRCGDR